MQSTAMQQVIKTSNQVSSLAAGSAKITQMMIISQCQFCQADVGEDISSVGHSLLRIVMDLYGMPLTIRF